MRQENTSSRNLTRTGARARVIDPKTGLAILAGALLLLAAILILTSGTARAISASPDPVLVRQPDGSSITLFLKGDEYFHWNEDETGFPVVRSANGSWVYAIEQLGQLSPTAVVAGSVNPLLAGLPKPDIQRLRTEALNAARPMIEADEDLRKAPAATTMYNLVLLVNFSDLTITSTTQEFDDLFNEVGHTADGATGSVKDYYDEVSYNQLDVVSIVVDPVTVSQGYAYYGANSGGFDIRPREMVAEALAALEARGFDFRSVDGDGDGWIDGLTVIHAGGGEEYSGNDPNYIWSHQWSLITTLTYDGTRMRPYHTEPARRGYDATPSSWGITRIGVICHETGHFIGLPDLYDYGYDSRGAGYFCLMAGGSWGNGGISPVHMNAACKYWLGWVTPTVISSGGPYTLQQVETNQSIYLLRGPFASTEYFLVENRQGVGFDVSLPGTERGILIWHVDETIGNNNDQTHYLCDLEEASGTAAPRAQPELGTGHRLLQVDQRDGVHVGHHSEQPQLYRHAARARHPSGQRDRPDDVVQRKRHESRDHRSGACRGDRCRRRLPRHVDRDRRRARLRQPGAEPRQRDDISRHHSDGYHGGQLLRLDRSEPSRLHRAHQGHRVYRRRDRRIRRDRRRLHDQRGAVQVRLRDRRQRIPTRFPAWAAHTIEDAVDAAIPGRLDHGRGGHLPRPRSASTRTST